MTMYPRSNRHIAGTDGIVFAGCWLVPRHAIGTPLPALRDTNGTPLLRSLCLASVLNRFTGHEASLALRSRNAFSQRQELLRKSMLSRTPLFKSVAASHRGWIVAAYALPGKRMACRRQQASQPDSQLACQVFPAQSGPMDAVELAVLDQHAKARAQTPGITPYARAIHRGRSAPSAEQ